MDTNDTVTNLTDLTFRNSSGTTANQDWKVWVFKAATS